MQREALSHRGKAKKVQAGSGQEGRATHGGVPGQGRQDGHPAGRGGVGWVRRQLDQYGELVGIVVGKYLELSEGGHMLLDAMARSRMAKMERKSGLAAFNPAMDVGVVTGQGGATEAAVRGEPPGLHVLPTGPAPSGRGWREAEREEAGVDDEGGGEDEGGEGDDLGGQGEG